MARSLNTILSIERFAQMLATLDGGVPSRDAFLGASGLNQSSWRQVQQQWLPRLASGDATFLATTFARTYAETRLRLIGRPTGQTRDKEMEVDETCEVATVPREAPALPFVAPQPHHASHGETREFLALDVSPVLAVELSSSRAPRFNTQTGQPLPLAAAASSDSSTVAQQSTVDPDSRK